MLCLILSRKWRIILKTLRAYKIWQIFYPIGIYYVVSSLAFFGLEALIGTGQDTYMLRQMICAAITIPFVMSFYREDRRVEKIVYGKDGGDSKKEDTAKSNEDTENSKFADRKEKKHVVWAVLSIFSSATLGIAVNNFIAMTPLIQASAGFNEANEAFFGGAFLYELSGSCLMIPIAEELLYRGVVYKRLRILYDMRTAVILSAVIFGLIHFNLVQFLYAGILGLLLAFLMEKTGKLWAPILGHMAANTVAVVRQETGWLSFSYEPTAAGIGFSLLMLAAAGGMVWYLGKKE